MVLQKRGMFVVLIALVLLLIPLLSTATVNGCYVYSGGSEDIYCVDDVIDTDAQKDCDKFTSCEMKTHFLPGKACSTVDDCKQVTCSVDCQVHALGICKELGGRALTDQEFPLWCSPGCCKIPTAGEDFCQFNLNKFQCEDRAKKLGVSLSDIFFDNSPGMSAEQCNQLYCKQTVTPSTLTGFIVNGTQNAVGKATVTIESTNSQAITDGLGKYTISNIKPGTYIVKATAQGYSPGFLSVTIPPGKTIEKNITVGSLVGTGSIQGLTSGPNGKSVSGVSVTWKGPVSGSTTDSQNGQFVIPKLPSGEYIITVSKIGFGPDTKTIKVDKSITKVQFQLKELAFVGIKGRTFLDKNNDKKATSDEAMYGVKIYIDGVQKAVSAYKDGSFEIPLTVQKDKQRHKITASYQDFNLEATVELNKGSSLERNLLLTRFIGECTFPNPIKDVETFSLHHVRGKKAVELRWVKPCPEVLTYQITKKQGDSVIESFTIPSSSTTYIDSNVEWGKSYTYELIAKYDRGRQTKANIKSIILGNEFCEGRFDEKGGWSRFCLNEKEKAKTVWTCNDQNQIAGFRDCSKDGNEFFCAPAGSKNAVCKSAQMCSMQNQGADPFGLYYNKEQCYGTKDLSKGSVNFCTFDYTDSTVNTCQRCDTITSCFDYKGKDACQVNSCVDQKCKWVDAAADEKIIDYSRLFQGLNVPTSVSAETGAGYCVQEDYKEDDKCSLCSPGSSLFENYFCTTEVCSALGACYTNKVTKDKPLQYCETCGDKPTLEDNCYSYNFESECTGGQAISKSSGQEFTLSQDQCNWNRCAWVGPKGGIGACVKDGDADGKDDCAVFSTIGQRNACKQDNAPPRTIISSQNSIISTKTDSLTFNAHDDENALGSFGYCVTNANTKSASRCTSFTEIKYEPNKKNGTISLAVVNLTNIKKGVAGSTYAVHYYSKDEYFNQENVQKAFFYVDTVAPNFVINQEITTVADTTTLTVYLEQATEPMECSFDIAQILPQGPTQSLTAKREDLRKEVTFKDLKGIRYDLNVTCADDHGNTQQKSKSFVFDHEERIDIISPAPNSIVALTKIPFSVRTQVAATCSLFTSADNQKIADFAASSDKKEHKTAAVSGFTEGEYPATYKVVCKETLTPDTYEDFFSFSVDFTGPKTNIILQEGNRTEKPQGFGWEEFFIRSAQVQLECVADGFKCLSTHYCLGGGCQAINDTKYQPYNNSFTVTKSTQICYYSLDEAKNPIFQPECGDIKIEGYGITLEKPIPHWFEGEVWGVSNEPEFVWQFSTKVPTRQCYFDFKQGFDPAKVPSHKILKPTPNLKYVVEKFPTDVFTDYPKRGGVKEVYVRCEDVDGIMSPEQKMNLEFDPTAPTLKKAYADPNKVFEEVSTTLFAETDDKTLCKYSDDSSGRGSKNYDTMEFSFDGVDNRTLARDHQTEYKINFVGAKKDFLFNVQCVNGAHNKSNIKQVAFFVDYSNRGNILLTEPSGYLNTKDVTLRVETSKNALCSYNLEGNYTSFAQGSGARVHLSELKDLNDSEYRIPVACKMGDFTAEGLIHFTIDTTAPTITEVYDGNYTCGANTVNVMAYSNEENLTTYHYQVFDKGLVEGLAELQVPPVFESNTNLTNSSNSTNSTQSTNKALEDYLKKFRENQTSPSSVSAVPDTANILVFNKTVNEPLPIEIPTSNLTKDHKYTVKVQGKDAAGNLGSLTESDGFIVTPSNYTLCKEDTGAPSVAFFVNETHNTSCLSTHVEMKFEDELGVKEVLYGVGPSQDQCNTTLPYSGQKLKISKTSYVCYFAVDVRGNNVTGSQRILFDDADSDGIRNSCDRCNATTAGGISDQDGCSLQGGPIDETDSNDADGDGLPDEWENEHHKLGCEMLANNPDSDGDGTHDGLEDYDLDERSNFEEFTVGTNPCIADAAPEQPQEEDPVTQDPIGQTPTIPTAPQQQSVVGWILLMMGMLFVVGGSGYLVYFYLYDPKGRQIVSGRRPQQSESFTSTRPKSMYTPAAAQKPGIINTIKNKWAARHKEGQQRVKSRRRSALFSQFVPKDQGMDTSFTKESQEIPHVEKVIKKETGSPLDRLGSLVKKYQKHKEEIKPGLKHGEKSVFAKLEKLGSKTQDKKIHEVASKKEAQDIFKKLKEISKKRKRK